MTRVGETVTRAFSRDAQIAFLVVLVALGLRWAFAVWLAAREPAFVAGFDSVGNPSLYREALRFHLLEYLAYNHTAPPLSILRDWFVDFMSDRVPEGLVSLMVVGICDSLAAGLGYLVTRQLGAGRLVSVIAGMLISHRYLLLEASTMGVTWDAMNPFLATLYLWCLIGFVQAPGKARALVAGCAGLVLISSHNFGTPMVVATLIAAGIFIVMRNGRTWLPVIAAVPPLLIIGVTVVSNGMQHGLWSMSTGVGQNLLQAYSWSFKDPSGEGRGVWQMAKREGYPDWWIWCYDEAGRRDLHASPTVASWYGTCMFRRSGDDLVPDYSGLRDYFAANPDPAMQAVLEKDMAIAAERPWLWSGPGSWRITGVSVAYGKISKRVMADLLFSRPDRFVRRFVRTLRYHWLYNGAVSYTLLNRAPYSEPGIVYAINLAIIPLFYLGNFIAILAMFRIAWRAYGKLRGRVPDLCRGPREEARAILAVAITSIMSVSVLLACCENYRHALVLLPVMLALALDALARRDFWMAFRDAAGVVMSVFGRLRPGRRPAA